MVKRRWLRLRVVCWVLIWCLLAFVMASMLAISRDIERMEKAIRKLSRPRPAWEVPDEDTVDQAGRIGGEGGR